MLRNQRDRTLQHRHTRGIAKHLTQRAVKLRSVVAIPGSLALGIEVRELAHALRRAIDLEHVLSVSDLRRQHIVVRQRHQARRRTDLEIERMHFLRLLSRLESNRRTARSATNRDGLRTQLLGSRGVAKIQLCDFRGLTQRRSAQPAASSCCRPALQHRNQLLERPQVIVGTQHAPFCAEQALYLTEARLIVGPGLESAIQFESVGIHGVQLSPRAALCCRSVSAGCGIALPS